MNNIAFTPSLLIIDHDEQLCKTKLDGDCAYLIEVSGASKFTITGTHFQQNHKQLQENVLLSDFVNYGQYKYYEFTILDGSQIESIKFHLDSLHGDADLYVKAPNESKELSSTHSNGRTDEVVIKGYALVGVYLVKVHAMSFSTYNLLVKVTRRNAVGIIEKPMYLTEGIPHQGDLISRNNTGLFAINLRQDQLINIEVATTQGSWAKFYVSAGSRPTPQNHQWRSNNGALTIISNYTNQPNQAFYILITASTEQWLSQPISNYHYTIIYKSEDTIQYLKLNHIIDLHSKNQQTQYFRHFFTPSEFINSTLTLSLTLWAGDALIYTSFSPDDKHPQNPNQFMKSKQYSPNLGAKSKLVQIPSEELFKNNPSCMFDPKMSADEPCAIYFGIHCTNESDCTYSIKLTSNSNEVETLMLGISQHGILESKQYKYYIIELNEKYDKDLQIILTSKEGNADLYVNIMENYDGIDSLKLPTLSNYLLKSERILEQDIIRIAPQTIENCYQINEPKQGGARSCIFIIAIFSPDFQLNFTDPLATLSEQLTKYSLIAFTDLVYLQSQLPIKSTVKEGEFHYYIIESTCDICQLIISLSQIQQGGDPDLYINYGDQRLPTLNEYDFAQTTVRSDLLTLDIRSQFFIENDIHSMKGPYIVGVFGNRQATYSISFSQEANPISVLIDGQAVKSTQDPYEIMYFTWYNSHAKLDIRINMIVKSGLADLYISTFDEQSLTDTLAQRLPKSKRDSWTYWVSEDNKPTSNVQKQSFIITNQERYYCYECIYVIAVVTHSLEADYILYVDVFDAIAYNSRFIKIGEFYSQIVEPGELVIMRFVIDDETEFKLQQTVNSESANVISTLSFDSRGGEEYSMENLKLFVLFKQFEKEDILTSSAQLRTNPHSGQRYAAHSGVSSGQKNPEFPEGIILESNITLN